MTARLDMLLRDAWSIYEDAVAVATEGDRTLKATVVLFSGGNDSTTVAHLFRKIATHAGHANTSIGVEQTRQYVRDTCASWNLPLLEVPCRPGETYRDLVLGNVRVKTGPKAGKVVWQGFPGPAAHYIMYNRLKQRALEAMRRDLIANPRKERLIFVTGLRQTESQRRKDRAPVTREGSAVFCNPITHWTPLDMNDYRRLCGDVPRNEVSDLLHMSGECLCGAFAHPGELDEIGEWFPEVAAEIRDLEAEAEALGIPNCRWGKKPGSDEKPKSGRLCSSCDARFAPDSTSNQEVAA